MITNMTSSVYEKEWRLSLKGASGNPPTEHVIVVGKDTIGTNGLNITNGFFKPKIVANKGNMNKIGHRKNRN